jgi:ribosomal protein S18 acetylase RimI-like enzyme
MGFPFLDNITNLKTYSGEKWLFCIDSKPQLPKLKYPVIKNLTILEDEESIFKELKNELKKIDNKLFVITESYNDNALKFIESENHEETYFCQIKLLKKLEKSDLPNQKKLPEDIKIKTFKLGEDEINYVKLYNETLGFLGSTIDINFINEIVKRPSFNAEGYFFAFKDETPIGFITVEKQPWGNDPEFGYLYQAGLMPQFKGKGVATALMKNAFNFAHKAGIKRIGVGVRRSNESALKYFKNHGFKEKFSTIGYLLKL